MRQKLAVVLRAYASHPWMVAGALLYLFAVVVAALAASGSTGPYSVSSVFDTRHSRVTESGFSVYFFDFMLSMLLLAILMLHVGRHFSNSASMLLPNFTAPHLIIPVVVLVGHVAMFSMIRTHVYGSHLIPSIVASSFVILGFCVANTTPTRRYVMPVLLIVVNPGMMFLMPRVCDLLESPYWRLFQIGEYPVLACFIVIAELGLLAMTLQHIWAQRN